MSPELRKAHQENDKAVMRAYGFWCKLNTESECVAELMKMYQNWSVVDMKIEDINFTLPTAEIFENKICTIFARFGKN